MYIYIYLTGKCEAPASSRYTLFAAQNAQITGDTIKIGLT